MRRVTVRAVLAVTLVTILVVLGADITVSQIAESRIEAAVTDELGGPVQATLDGRLAGLAVLRGHVAGLRLEGVDVPLEDSPLLASLSVHLRDLELVDGQPVSGTGTFVARLTEIAVQQQAPPLLVDLIALEDDRAVLGAGLLQIPLQLSVSGEDLVVTPTIADPTVAGLLDGLLGGALQDGIRIPLDLPTGVTVQEVTVSDGFLVLTGTLNPVVVVGG